MGSSLDQIIALGRDDEKCGWCKITRYLPLALSKCILDFISRYDPRLRVTRIIVSFGAIGPNQCTELTKAYPHVQEGGFVDCRIEARVLKILSQTWKLQTFSLADSYIEDTTEIVALLSMAGLEHVVLSGTNLTKEVVQKMRTITDADIFFKEE